MRNSPDENGDRPTLPSIWDLFGDELSDPSRSSNFRASASSVHPLRNGQDGRYDGRHPAHQDHPSILSDRSRGPSLSLGETSSFIQQHQVPNAPGPTFYQSSIPQHYYPPQEVHQTHGDPSLNHNLPYRTRTTPSADYSYSTDDSLGRQGGFPQTTQDNQAFNNHETNPGANYGTFRCFQPLEFREESGTTAKHECEHCGKAFNRPSTLRIHLNSHTGEKPFICPVEGCNRGFSVLSNMRRHARVHAQPTTREGTAGGETASLDHHS